MRLSGTLVFASSFIILNALVHAEMPSTAQSASADEETAAPSAGASSADAPTAGTRTISALASEAEAMALADAFLRRVAVGRYDEAFAMVRPYFPVPEARIAKIEKETTQQLGMAELQFGATRDFSFVSGDTVQSSVLRLRFLQRFERDAIYWEFVFYKPAESVWVLNALGFDDEIRGLFK